MRKDSLQAPADPGRLQAKTRADKMKKERDTNLQRRSVDITVKAPEEPEALAALQGYMAELGPDKSVIAALAETLNISAEKPLEYHV